MSRPVDVLAVSEQVRLANERMARIRANPFLAYVGGLWDDLEFEQQAECRRYVADGLLCWKGQGRHCRVQLTDAALAKFGGQS